MAQEVPKVPDWRIYKWENVPELRHVHDELAKEGLKDPWLRNEVWRYYRRNEVLSTRSVIWRSMFGRPFLLAIPTGFVLSLLVQKFWKDPVDPRVPEFHHHH